MCKLKILYKENKLHIREVLMRVNLPCKPHYQRCYQDASVFKNGNDWIFFHSKLFLWSILSGRPIFVRLLCVLFRTGHPFVHNNFEVIVVNFIPSCHFAYDLYMYIRLNNGRLIFSNLCLEILEYAIKTHSSVLLCA